MTRRDSELIWDADWVDEGVAGLATADYLQVDLDYLVDMRKFSRSEITTVAIELFSQMLARFAERSIAVRVELAIPLFVIGPDGYAQVEGLPLPEIGSDVDEILADLRYPRNLRGISIPGFDLSRTDQVGRVVPKTRVTITGLATSRAFAKPVVVEHWRREFAHPGDENSWLVFTAPISTAPLVEFVNPNRSAVTPL